MHALDHSLDHFSSEAAPKSNSVFVISKKPYVALTPAVLPQALADRTRTCL